MAVEAQMCPQCGAAVQFGEGQTEVVCSHCGTTVVKAAAAGAPSVEQELAAEKVVQETVRREERLQSHGRPATGKIVTAQATGIFRQTAEGRAVLMSLAVEVQPDGEPPFAAEAKVLVGLAVVNKYRPGTLLDLRYDPQDPAQVSIEGRPGSPEEQARRRQAKEQARQRQAKEQQAQRAKQGPAPATAAPAWGGPRHRGVVPVPQAFDAVSDLGPASAVFERDPGTWPFPSFGPPKPNELVLYRDGFAFHSGKDLHTWRWEEVAVIVSDLTEQISSRGMGFDGSDYTLTKSSGDKVILDDRIKGIRRALESIKQNVTARLLPPLAQAYHSGQAVTFGPVTVHKQNGLQLDGKLYPWDTILNIKVESGRFKITLRDEKKHEARTSHIPNIELLGQLIGLKFYESSLAYL
jgi:hypothetical protein